MRIPTKNTLAATAAACLALVLCGADPSGGDWPMWGGTPGRNMVGTMSGAPTRWNVQTKENIKWVAPLGSHAYGNPVVSGGMVFVGTNNALALDPKQPGDRGVLMAFRESDGEFLWQAVSDKLESGMLVRVSDCDKMTQGRSSHTQSAGSGSVPAPAPAPEPAPCRRLAEGLDSVFSCASVQPRTRAPRP